MVDHLTALIAIRVTMKLLTGAMPVINLTALPVTVVILNPVRIKNMKTLIRIIPSVNYVTVLAVAIFIPIAPCLLLKKPETGNIRLKT